MSLLKLENIKNGYGNKPVLFDIDLSVEKGEIVSIIGPNGSGKSTILKTIGGVLPAWEGSLTFNGKDIKGIKSSEIIKVGIAFSPQGNRTFDELTVMENLETGGYILAKSELKVRIEEIVSLFPQLSKKLKMSAGCLSGGEQQMLSVARALMPYPKMIMLDEPSLGLQPNLLADVFKNLKMMNEKLGISILIVEQKVREVLEISKRTYSLKLGRVSYSGSSSDLIYNKEKLKELFL